jgi:putative exporter of polyketide antibiotics
MDVERIKALLAEYGRLALATYFAVFALVFAGFGLAIALGMQVASAEGGAGVLGAAYVATKLTQPLRIAATMALTPLVARVIVRFSKPRTEELAPPEPLSPDTRPPSL